MIPRYSRKEMAALWAPETRFRIWFEIEAHACDAQAALGLIPQSAAAAVWERGAFEVARIDEIERETRHDVIAFLTNLAEHVGPEARFVHQGMTSSDVLDTCLAVQLARAADLLDAGIGALMDALERRAREHRLTPCIGRSHGIHAEPTTFGLKMAQATMPSSIAQPCARIAAAREGNCGVRDFRRGGDLCQYRPARLRRMSPNALGLADRADFDPDRAARPPCRLFFAALRPGCQFDRTVGNRDPPSAAHRSCARQRKRFSAGAEGVVVDAA